MDNFLINTIIGGAVSGATATAGFFIGKRKRTAETGSIEIENLKKIIDIHTQTIQYLEKQVDELRIEITKLFSENIKLRKS
jgi:TolA-binding protein